MEADKSFKLNLPMDSIDQMMELEEAIKEDFSKENLLVGKMCTNKTNIILYPCKNYLNDRETFKHKKRKRR